MAIHSSNIKISNGKLKDHPDHYIIGDLNNVILDASFINIKEEKKPRIAFRNELRILKKAIDALNIIMMINANGKIISTNKLFHQLSAYTKEDLHDLNIMQLRSGNMDSNIYQDLISVIQEGKTWKGELEHRAKTGEIFWTETTVIPMDQYKGAPTSYLTISTNITERKKAESKITALNKRLEREIKKRRADIRLATEELEAFSYSVSHDLRAPLRAITGFAGLLNEEYGNDLENEAQRYLSIIEQGTMQMSHLIDDLLSYSKVGRIDIHKEFFDPTSLVTDIINNEKTSLTKKYKFIYQNLNIIYGDQKLINLVLTNLILNAIKFSKHVNKPQITIGSIRKNEELVYFIEDNGVGFDMRYSSKLFNVFQRLHTSEEFEGTGVGLAIVERIIKKHGGHVWAESVPNTQTRFYFSIPNRKENEK